MRIVAVSVGRPRRIQWRDRVVETSIWKTPVAGRVHVGTLNLDGDEQSDLTVHGGADKAVYAYPAEHYARWRTELPDAELPWGVFGENLTIEGLLEPDVCIGDRFRVGSAEMAVTQPRMPCYKLGIRFGRADMVKLFQHSLRSGFYFGVLHEGDVAAGDPIERLARDERGLTVTDVVNLYSSHAVDRSLLQRASIHPGLPEGWRDYFRNRLEEPAARGSS